MKRIVLILVVMIVTAITMSKSVVAAPDQICQDAKTYCNIDKMNINHILDEHCNKNCQETGKSQFDKEHCSNQYDAMPELCKAILETDDCKGTKNERDIYVIESSGVLPNIGEWQPMWGEECLGTGRVRLLYDPKALEYPIPSMYPIKPRNIQQ